MLINLIYGGPEKGIAYFGRTSNIVVQNAFVRDMRGNLSLAFDLLGFEGMRARHNVSFDHLLMSVTYYHCAKCIVQIVGQQKCRIVTADVYKKLVLMFETDAKAALSMDIVAVRTTGISRQSSPFMFVYKNFFFKFYPNSLHG